MGLPRGGLDTTPEFYVFQLLALVLLLVACVNVAILVFARTAKRFRELAVRTALGASRARIVSQIFVETLTLAVLAAGAGVSVIHWIFGRLDLGTFIGATTIPYWFSLQATPESAAWALVFSVLSATAAGVGPALWITRGDIRQSMRRAEAGRSGVRFGGATSALIIADVAIAVAVVGVATSLARHMTDGVREETLAGIAAEDFLAAELRLALQELHGDVELDRQAFRDRLREIQLEVVERLRSDPRVRSVAIADALPRMDHRARMVSVEGVDVPGERPGRYVRVARVDVDFLSALGGPLLAGRDFDRADADSDAPPVVVNTMLVDRVLGGLDPIGRRLRFHEPGDGDDVTWHEIVGVVGHLGMNVVGDQGAPGVYVPVPPGGLHPIQLGLHIGASPETFTPRLREIVAGVDPDAILDTPMPLDEVHQGDWYLMAAVTGGLALLVLILVALAASGIYAIVSFSVAERTREIGIRNALGASRHTLVLTILRRSLVQLFLGAALGVPMAAWVLRVTAGSSPTGSAPGSLTIALAIGVATACVVGLLSCVAPARAALGVEPTDALRGEG
jgi:putative ABC transport system permease protein